QLQSGSVTRTYSYGLELINQRQPVSGTLTTSFYGYDGHGSVRFLTSSTGAITDTYDYDAFGNVISSTGSTPNNYLFASEQFDAALGVYYNRARYYDQRQGRFWSMDTQDATPVDSMSLHRYLYADADPVDNIDPLGLYTQQFGYYVEDAVQKAYTGDFGANAQVTYGGWSRLGTAGQKVRGKLLFRLMPDILDRRDTRGDRSAGRIWMEVKPLTISGIGRAAASWGLYSAAFSPFGISPDSQWLRHGRMFFVKSGNATYSTLVFNCGGILFYTTNKQDYDLFKEIAQGALGFGIAVGVGTLAGTLVNALTTNAGSEVQTINNLVRISIRAEGAAEAEIELDAGVVSIPAA